MAMNITDALPGLSLEGLHVDPVFPRLNTVRSRAVIGQLSLTAPEPDSRMPLDRLPRLPVLERRGDGAVSGVPLHDVGGDAVLERGGDHPASEAVTGPIAGEPGRGGRGLHHPRDGAIRQPLLARRVAVARAAEADEHRPRRPTAVRREPPLERLDRAPGRGTQWDGLLLALQPGVEAPEWLVKPPFTKTRRSPSHCVPGEARRPTPRGGDDVDRRTGRVAQHARGGKADPGVAERDDVVAI